MKAEYVFLAVALIALAATVAVLAQQRQECKGAFVRAVIWYECVQRAAP